MKYVISLSAIFVLLVLGQTSPAQQPFSFAQPQPTPPQVPAPPTHLDGKTAPEGSSVLSGVSRSSIVDIDPLRRNYQSAELAAQKTAALLRGLPKKGAGNDSETRQTAALEQQLRLEVVESFRLRQQLHQAEVAELERKLTRTRELIRQRDLIEEQIISRRVMDLLNPNLVWDADVAAVMNGSGQLTQPVGESPRAAGDVKGKDASVNYALEQLQGDWHLVSLKSENLHAEMAGKLRVESNEWTIVQASGEAQRFRVVLHGADNPTWIDLVSENPTPDMPRTSRGRYLVREGELTIAWGTDPALRPAGFGGEDVLVQTWRRKPNKEPAVTDADSVPEPLAEVLESTLAAIRRDNTRSLLPTFNVEWKDDIEAIRACPGLDRLSFDQVYADDSTAFAVTAPLANDAGRHLIVEIAVRKDHNGTWGLQLIDLEPADNGHRDIDRFRDKYPGAKPLVLLSKPPGGSKK